MKYYSLQGKPLWVENLDPNIQRYPHYPMFSTILSRRMTPYFTKGTVAWGFTPPHNFLGDKDEFFARYQLWDNEVGWATVGKRKSFFTRFNNEFESRIPILAGDQVGPEWVHSAVAEWNASMKLWQGVVTTRKLPPTVRAYEQLNLFSNAQILFDTLMTELPELITKAIEAHTSTAISSPTGGKVTFTGGQALADAVLAEFKGKIESQVTIQKNLQV